MTSSGSRSWCYLDPADDTPGCTKEACQFNDNLRAFSRAGVAVVGISPDGAEKHVAFPEEVRTACSRCSARQRPRRDGADGALGLEDPVRQEVGGRDPVDVPRRAPTARWQRAGYHVRAYGHVEKVLAELGS